MTYPKKPDQSQAAHGTAADRTDIEDALQHNLESASLLAGLLAHGGRSGAQAAPSAEVAEFQKAAKASGLFDNLDFTKIGAIFKLLLELFGKAKGGTAA